MIDYIQNIIRTEQINILEKIVEKYGNKGDFNLEQLKKQFLSSNIVMVDDNFRIPKKRGRPKKTT
jgi:hypothetical protein